MITETRRCGGCGWWLYDTTFRQQLTSLETADFSKLNDPLYATTFLAYGTRRQCCPNCLLPDHLAEECALYNPRPMTELGIAPVGSVMRGGYEEKHAKGGEWRRKWSRRGHVMPGMMGSAWHSITSMTMYVQIVMGITRGPCVQLR